MLNEPPLQDAITQNAHMTSMRYNQDTMAINKNGKNLISMCQSLDLCILNGRLGSDKYIGKQTCFKSQQGDSVIDYIISDEKLVPYVYDLNVEMFDQCLSDHHLNLVFSGKHSSH